MIKNKIFTHPPVTHNHRCEAGRTMDHQKKKQLTQSVSFLQAHLALTAELLSSLKSEEVLTSEEVSTIQVRVLMCSMVPASIRVLVAFLCGILWPRTPTRVKATTK